MFRPKPMNYAVRFWMPNWGHGRSVEHAVDALAAANQFVTGIKAKFGEDADVLITSVEEAKEKA